MKYCIVILILLGLGCGVLEYDDTRNEVKKQKPATQVVIRGETQLEKYARLQTENNKQLKSNLPSEQVQKLKEEINRLTLKLLSKLDVLGGTQSIIIEPVSIAEKMTSKFKEVRD